MKILLVHSPYAQRGGEEQVVDTQLKVLRARGHDVASYEGHDAGPVVARFAPDVVHVHQQFPALRPSVYGAASARKVPVVQHLHNARLVCIQPFLVRDGVACEDCVGHSALPGVIHGCYRGSRVQSGAAAGIQAMHRRIWRREVSRFVAVSEAVAATAGTVLPADRITVCHNGLDETPQPRDPAGDAGYALYVGRLSAEKGVDLLVDAAAQTPDIGVVVVGDGPERASLERRAGANVEFRGRLDRGGVFGAIARARVLVVPSRGQEPFGLGVVEAAAHGVPAIVARVGGLPEIVRDGETGLVIAPFDAAAIARALRHCDAGRAHALGAAARRGYETRFTPDAFADRLLAIYDEVLASPNW